jgi:hypothetical protein
VGRTGTQQSSWLERAGGQLSAQVLSQCGATAVIMLVGDTYTLISCVSFINYLCYGVTVLGLLVLRCRRPALHRPIKVRPRKGGRNSWLRFWKLSGPPLHSSWAPGAGVGGSSDCDCTFCYGLGLSCTDTVPAHSHPTPSRESSHYSQSTKVTQAAGDTTDPTGKQKTEAPKPG